LSIWFPLFFDPPFYLCPRLLGSTPERLHPLPLFPPLSSPSDPFSVFSHKIFPLRPVFFHPRLPFSRLLGCVSPPTGFMQLPCVSPFFVPDPLPPRSGLVCLVFSSYLVHPPFCPLHCFPLLCLERSVSSVFPLPFNFTDSSFFFRASHFPFAIPVPPPGVDLPCQLSPVPSRVPPPFFVGRSKCGPSWRPQLHFMSALRRPEFYVPLCTFLGKVYFLWFTRLTVGFFHPRDNVQLRLHLTFISAYSFLMIFFVRLIIVLR